MILRLCHLLGIVRNECGAPTVHTLFLVCCSVGTKGHMFEYIWSFIFHAHLSISLVSMCLGSE